MPIQYHPNAGMILRCDFTRFIAPEMTKPRPVLVISPRPERNNKKTCIVVALSTTRPNPIEPFHCKIKLPDEIPANLSPECWVKGDMVYSFSLGRFDLYRSGRNRDGKREYYKGRVAEDIMKKVRKAVGSAIGINAFQPY